MHFPKIAWHKSWQKIYAYENSKNKISTSMHPSDIATNMLQKK